MKLLSELSQRTTEPLRPFSVSVVLLVPEHTDTSPPLILPPGAPLIVISFVKKGVALNWSFGISPNSIIPKILELSGKSFQSPALEYT